MADSLCKFLDTSCVTSSQFFATYFSAQKPFLLLPLHNPNLVRKRRRRKSFHIAFCSTPTSPNLDVISTHEHSDGSLLFRFGDPSEVAKEDELEEPLLGVEEVERDSEEEFSVVKVLDGDNEREVIVEKVEREAGIQAVTVATDAGVSESVVTNNKSNDFVEKETGSSENFLEDSSDEIGLISSVGIQDESVVEVDTENAEHVEEVFEKEDDNEASVPPPENSIPSLEVEEEMKDQSSDESFEELDDSGETNVIEEMPLSPKLEAEPILDEEVDQNLISESNEGESPLPPDENLPSKSLEEERKEDVENTVIMEVFGHEVVEDKSSEVLDSSKEATPAAAELILSSGATLVQYPSKAFAGGHEAYFVACGKWLGVADAVGSWSLQGSDPGVYAQELMQNSEFIVSQCDKDFIKDPKQVLNLSVSKTDSPGSSTVLIAHFDGKALHVANIGDSGFIVVRNRSVYRKSAPMLHEFNLPIQIEKGDDPSQLLEEYKIELDEGDIIVTATDALFDNLYDQEIVSIVSRSLEADKSPQEIAEILAKRVLEVGSSASGRSPFADAAQAAGYVLYTGGKRDDVVVVVSVVQKMIMSNEE